MADKFVQGIFEDKTRLLNLRQTIMIHKRETVDYIVQEVIPEQLMTNAMHTRDCIAIHFSLGLRIMALLHAVFLLT